MRTFKTKLAALIALFITSVCCKAQDKAQNTSRVLYYSVQNVSTVWNSSTSQKTNSTEDIKKYLEKGEQASTKKEDLYLIPTIKEFIKDATEFEEILLLPEERKKGQQIKDASLIIIAINKFDALLEFQFYLFEFKDEVRTQVGESSFFIDPKNDNYQNKIKVEVQKLFKDHYSTNKPPVARIRLGSSLIENGSQIYYRTTSDTIVLDGTSSEDDNTPKKNFQYSWEVSKSGKKNAFISNFNFEKGIQRLVISDTGTYIISLKVSDGIEFSNDNSSRVKIKIIPQPILEINKNSTYIIQSSFFTKQSIKRLMKDIEAIPFYITNYKNGTSLVFKYLESTNKKEKFYLENYLKYSAASLKLNDTHSYEHNQTLNIPGLYLDSSIGIKNTDPLKFSVNTDIKPGVHKYSVTAEYANIKSNSDEILIDYREKSALSIFFGGVRQYYSADIYIKKGQDISQYQYVNSTQVTYYATRVGIRGYLTQRLSVDVEFFSTINKNYSSVDSNSHLFSPRLGGKLNYDIFPLSSNKLRSGDSFIYWSVYVSIQELTRFDNSGNGDEKKIRSDALFGCGLKPRVQLFKNNPKIGNLYFEGEFGIQIPKSVEHSVNPVSYYGLSYFGFNLIYGFLK
jgi:hypothetical protein